MVKFFIRLFIIALVILGAAHVLPGLVVPNFLDAVIFAFVVGLCNATIAPILIICTFPLTVLTVGLFALVINAFTFWLASLISYGIEITSFWGAFWGGLITWITSFILNEWLADRHR